MRSTAVTNSPPEKTTPGRTSILSVTFWLQHLPSVGQNSSPCNDSPSQNFDKCVSTWKRNVFLPLGLWFSQKKSLLPSRNFSPAVITIARVNKLRKKSVLLDFIWLTVLQVVGGLWRQNRVLFLASRRWNVDRLFDVDTTFGGQNLFRLSDNFLSTSEITCLLALLRSAQCFFPAGHEVTDARVFSPGALLNL